MDASRCGSPVLVSDLERNAGQRWPAFTAGAIASGVLAAFTFPLRVGALGVGVLGLYRTTRGELTDGGVAEALAYADAAAAVLQQQLQRGHGAGAAGVDPAEWRWAPRRADVALGTAGDVVDALDHRAVVHQAAGMISVQSAVDVPAASVRLCSHAQAANRSILDVAADVVARRLRFDHSDAGITVTPPRPPASSNSAGEESS